MLKYNVGDKIKDKRTGDKGQITQINTQAIYPYFVKWNSIFSNSASYSISIMEDPDLFELDKTSSNTPKFKVGDIITNDMCTAEIFYIDSEKNRYGVKMNTGNAMYDFGWDYIESNFKLYNNNKCIHNWKEYTGLFETIEYCTKCNIKK